MRFFLFKCGTKSASRWHVAADGVGALLPRGTREIYLTGSLVVELYEELGSKRHTTDWLVVDRTREADRKEYGAEAHTEDGSEYCTECMRGWSVIVAWHVLP